MHQKQDYTILPGAMIKLIGLFVPVMHEMSEMLYQYSNDYFFDSSKFNRHFGYTPSTPTEIVDALLAEAGIN